MRNSKKFTLVRRLLNFRGFRLLAGGLACVVLSSWLLAQKPTAKTTTATGSGSQGGNPSPANPDLEQAEKLRDESVKLKAGLESAQKEIEEFKWLLTVIFGVGLIYSLAQGMLVNSAVKSYSDQALQALQDARGQVAEVRTQLDQFQEGAKARAREDFDKFRAGIEAQFPMFAGLEARLGYMASQLTGVYDHLSLGQDVYTSQGPIDRQRILYYERAIAAIEFLDVYRPDDSFQIFRGLCRFYVEKFSYLREGSDLERAKYYLHRALLLRPDKDFMISNEHGYIALVENKRDLAEKFLEESVRQKAGQQCAHYNLASISFEKMRGARSDGEAKLLIDKAIKHLRIAQGAPNWEDKPHPVKGSKVSYNLACALNRLAERMPEVDKPPLLRQAFDALERSVSEAPGERRSFAKDRLLGGDLGLLQADPLYTAKLDGFADLISKARQRES
jgi:hypothetical protein